MRVLHVITGLGLGGAERALLGLAQGLAPALVAQRIASLGAGDSLLQEFLDSDLDVVTVRQRAAPGKVAAVRRIRQDFRPDVIHAWMYHPVVAAPILSGSVPWIAGIRASLQSLGTERLATQLVIRSAALSSRLAQAVVYNSGVAALEHETIGYPQARRVVIPNGIDTELFSSDPERAANARDTLGVSGRGLLIGHAGRFHEVKNQVGLLDAVRILADRGVAFQLLMAGEGIDSGNRQLVSAIEARNLGQHVFLLGRIAFMRDFYDLCDVFANVSVGEAFPNVVAEAMAMELPIVATAAGDTLAIVSDHGIVVEIGDMKGIADGLFAFSQMDASRRQAIGRLGRERIATHFSPASATRSYLGTYEQAMRSGRLRHGGAA